MYKYVGRDGTGGLIKDHEYRIIFEDDPGGNGVTAIIDYDYTVDEEIYKILPLASHNSIAYFFKKTERDDNEWIL